MMLAHFSESGPERIDSDATFPFPLKSLNCAAWPNSQACLLVFGILGPLALQLLEPSEDASPFV